VEKRSTPRKATTITSSAAVPPWTGLLFALLLSWLPPISSAAVSYANVTLTNGDDLSVVVFLPSGVKPDEKTFYYASRFDHGSMIGVVTRTVSATGSHRLFEADMWRVPHNSNWPESGVGLASEFGVGDDGAFCYYRCGWGGSNDVTNGVLGYFEAKNGEPFLKIGVGKLLKGTCPTCDSTEDYRFNSPYLFAEPPVWTTVELTDNAVTLEHEAKLHIWGYKLVKHVALEGNVLSVTTTLSNFGQMAFSTAWYSHNFFTCDQTAVGPGYSIDLSIKGGSTRPSATYNNPAMYEEPGTWSWSTPLADYAKVRPRSDRVRVDMEKALPPGVRIKAEFINDSQTSGGFTIRACQTEITSSLDHPEQSMYAYNLYLERATLSPEPQILVHLEAGQASSWTQRLEIRELKDDGSDANLALDLEASVLSPSSSRLDLPPIVYAFPLFVVVAMAAWVFRQAKRDVHRYRQSYSSIPDHSPDDASDC
jgi:hypothetical protein